MCWKMVSFECWKRSAPLLCLIFPVTVKIKIAMVYYSFCGLIIQLPLFTRTLHSFLNGSFPLWRFSRIHAGCPLSSSSTHLGPWRINFRHGIRSCPPYPADMFENVNNNMGFVSCLPLSSSSRLVFSISLDELYDDSTGVWLLLIFAMEF